MGRVTSTEVADQAEESDQRISILSTLEREAAKKFEMGRKCRV
jgi:hypothetical protein